MSFKFPFTNYHELNLDWILKKVETLSVNAEADANTIATYEERLQTAETQAQNAETSATNAQSAATSAASVAENALTIANSAQSSADASGALASQAATKADAAQSAAESARQAAETAQATAANFDGRITSAEQQASEALNMAQSFDEQARAAITTANNAANVATEAQATANATALELARQRTALETIGSQQTAAINSAGASQVTAINNAGQAVLDSIPADYMNGVELVKDYTLGLYPQIETDYSPVVNFDNGADNIPVKGLDVNIIPYQSGIGDPSPTNIRPISGYTGVKVMRTGKNLMNGMFTQGDYNGANYNIRVSQSVANRTRVKAGMSYTFSLRGANYTNYWLFICDEQNNIIQTITTSGTILPLTTITFTPAVEGLLTPVFGRYVNDSWQSITIADVQASTPMLELGSTASDYEPFSGNQFSINFPSSAGTVYSGILSINSDNTGTLVIDRIGTQLRESSYRNIVGNTKLCYISENSVLSSFYQYSKTLCSHFKIANVGGWEQVPQNECIVASNNYVGINYGNSVESFTTYLESEYERGTPVTIVAVLATPITVSLSASEIGSILSTFYGVNNVWSDAGNTSITYRADLGLFITENCIANYTKFTGMIAGVETGLTASKTYSAGDYFIIGQKLYKALTNIASGATFTLGTNCEETTVGAELVLVQ